MLGVTQGPGFKPRGLAVCPTELKKKIDTLQVNDLTGVGLQLIVWRSQHRLDRLLGWTRRRTAVYAPHLLQGQLGTGPNKAERAREREAILRQLEEMGHAARRSRRLSGGGFSLGCFSIVL